MAGNSIVKVLRGILSDLDKLSDEQLSLLMEGKAKFKYFDPNEAKPVKASKQKAPANTALFDSIAVHLKTCRTTDEADFYLRGQNLSAADAKSLAAHLGIFVPGKKTKEDAINAIVRSAVGSRLDSAAIGRL